MRIALALFLLAVSAFGQDADFRRQIRATTYTRDLLEATTAAEARRKLGVTSTTTASIVETNWTSLYSYTGATNGQTIRVLDRGGFDWTFVSGATGTNLAEPGVAGGVFRLQNWDGSVRAYGATGDGVTDDWAALQAAVNATTNRVLFPRGDYLCSMTVTGQTSVRLDFTDGAKIIRPAGASGYTFRFEQTSPTFLNRLSSDLRRGNQTFGMTDTNGFAAGDWIVVKDMSSRDAGNTASDSPNQELIQIERFDGTTCDPVGIIGGDYRQSATNYIGKINPLDVVVTGAHIVITTNNSTAGGFFFNWSTSQTLIGCKVEGMYLPAYHWQRSANGLAVGCRAWRGNGVEQGGIGYGFNVSRSSHNIVISACETIGVRENQCDSGARDVTFIGCTFKGHYDDGVNSHGQGVEGMIVDSCRIDQCRGYGVLAAFDGANDSDRITILRNNEIECNLSGVYVSSTVNTNRNVTVEDNKIRAQRYGIEIGNGGQGLHIRGNRVSPFDNGSGGGIFLTNCYGATLDGNKIDGIISGFGIQVNTGSSNNIIRNTHFERLTVTALDIKGDANTIDGLTLLDCTGIGYYDTGIGNELISFSARKHGSTAIYLNGATYPRVDGFRVSRSSDALIITNCAYPHLANGKLYAWTNNSAVVRSYSHNAVFQNVWIDGLSALASVTNGDVGFYIIHGTNQVMDSCGVWPQGYMDNAVYINSAAPSGLKVHNGFYGLASGAVSRVFGGVGVNDVDCDGVTFQSTQGYAWRTAGAASNWRFNDCKFYGVPLPALSSSTGAIANLIVQFCHFPSATGEADALSFPAGSTYLATMNSYTNSPQMYLSLPVMATNPPTPPLGNIVAYGARNGTNQVLATKWESGTTNTLATEP